MNPGASGFIGRRLHGRAISTDALWNATGRELPGKEKKSRLLRMYRGKRIIAWSRTHADAGDDPTQAAHRPERIRDETGEIGHGHRPAGGLRRPRPVVRAGTDAAPGPS